MKGFLNWGLTATCSVALFLAMLIAALIYAPQTPLPPQWNPTKPFDADEPLGRFTQLKLERALRDPVQCAAVLGDLNASFDVMPDKVETPVCHIKSRVNLQSIGSAKLRPVQTRCEVAVRLAMWGKHVVQPAARDLLNSSVVSMTHYNSYACRPIRSTRGTTGRMSQHASANAIDIAGFRLKNAQQITLQSDWTGDQKRAAFLRIVRDGACDWFNAVLSPDYNALHADHFHFDLGRWTSCR